jgi:hypothetical protein
MQVFDVIPQEFQNKVRRCAQMSGDAIAITVFVNGAFDEKHMNRAELVQKAQAFAGRNGRVLFGADAQNKMDVKSDRHAYVTAMCRPQDAIVAKFATMGTAQLSKIDLVIAPISDVLASSAAEAQVYQEAIDRCILYCPSWANKTVAPLSLSASASAPATEMTAMVINRSADQKDNSLRDVDLHDAQSDAQPDAQVVRCCEVSERTSNRCALGALGFIVFAFCVYVIVIIML